MPPTTTSTPPTTLGTLLRRGITSSFILALSVTLTALFTLGAYDTFKNVEDNKCQMTWMFDYPLFTQIPVTTEYKPPPEEDGGQNPPYKLYVYSEGSPKTPPYTGIPVLFIPGNAGSFKQVRSLASVSLQKSKSLGGGHPHQHFDYFTLDLNSEYSALYGYVLPRQRAFTLAAISTIQSLYPSVFHPVTLIGHSVGGLIAKSTLSTPSSTHTTPLLITLATPHSSPPLILDPNIDIFYRQLNTINSTTTTLTVSIAGGPRDFLVPQQQTLHHQNDIQINTAGIPGVWSSTDHQCIVWCKQLVVTLVRALFDSVTYSPTQRAHTISTNTTLLSLIFNYHLVRRSAGKSALSAHPQTHPPPPPPSSTVVHTEILTTTFCVEERRRTTYVMFPSLVLNTKSPQTTQFVFTTNNTQAKNWIFLCNNQDVLNNVRYCSSWTNASPWTELLPHTTTTSRTKVATIPASLIATHSHVIVKMEPNTKRTCVSASPLSSSPPLITPHLKVSSPFSLHLVPFAPGYLPRLFAWSLSSENNCSSESSDVIATFSHSHFKQHRFLRNESLSIRLYDTSHPATPTLTIHTPIGGCQLNLSLSLATVETAGNLFQSTWRLLPSYISSILLLSLHHQTSPTDFSNIHSVLISNTPQLTLIPAITVASLHSFLPTDWPSHLTTPLIHVILFPIAYLLLLISATALSLTIVQTGNVIHSNFIKLLTSRLTLPRFLSSRLPPNPVETVADFALDVTFSKFPVILSVFLVSLALATSGGTALAATLAIYLVKLFKMYDDAMSDLLKGKISDVREALSPFNFHLSVALVHVVLTALNLPSLIHWAHSPQTNSLQYDAALYLALMVTPTLAVLLQNNTPNFHPQLWTLHRYVFYAMGLVLPLWTTFRLYLISFILTFTLITTATCQLISSLGAAATTPTNNDDDTPPQQSTTEQQQHKKAD